MTKIEQNGNKLIIECKEITNYLKFLIYFILLIIWLSAIFVVPFHSQLECYSKINVNRIDCQLKESYLLNYKPTITQINNLVNVTKDKQHANNIILYSKSDFIFKYLKKHYVYFKPKSELSFIKEQIDRFISARDRDTNISIDRTLNIALSRKPNIVTFIIMLIVKVSIPAILLWYVIAKFVSNAVQTTYHFDGDVRIVTIHQERNFLEDIVTQYSFDNLNCIKLEYSQDEESDISYPTHILVQFDDYNKYKLQHISTRKDIEEILSVIKNYLQQYIILPQELEEGF